MPSDMIHAIFIAFLQTVYMVFLSSAIAILLGIPLGVLLATTQANGIIPNKHLYRILGAITNAVRSIPFIILLVAIIPLTRLIVGTSIGTNAAIVPLCIGAIPFVGRLVENSIYEIPGGLIEAGQSMGASTGQIILKILLPEALPSIINGMTITIVTLVGYSAMAGAIGGGGLGDLAIRYGYERFDVKVMIITVIILIVLIQGIQSLGDYLSKRCRH